jgi:ADP-heptose:LPS heptosyltransferase
MADARRILLVRSDGIGDALVLAPLVAALRDAGHTLGAVLSTRNAEAFAPGVFAAVHVLERIPWPRHGSTPQSYAQALAEARAQRYDVALIASEEPEAYTFPRAANIPQRIGFANGFEKPLKSAWVLAQVTRALTRPASAQRAQEHEVETLFRLGKNLHAEPHPTRDAARLRPLVVAATAAHGGVVFQLTPKWDDIGVPPDALRGAARAVAAAYPCSAVAAPADERYARTIAAAAGIPLSIGAGLGPWKEALAGARAVVTPDGGAAHVAGMCGVPCIDVFPATDDGAARMRRWYPWASRRVWALEASRRVTDALPQQVLAGVAYADSEGAPSLADEVVR